MDDNESHLLEPSSSFSVLVQGTEISKAILFQNGEKIKNIEIKKDAVGGEYVEIYFKTLPSGNITIDKSKHFSLGFSGFKTFLPDQ